ncbi:MAG TPA: hypothetical protein VIM53_00100 [Candidatus Saccharimonadales bacterium]
MKKIVVVAIVVVVVAGGLLAFGMHHKAKNNSSSNSSSSSSSSSNSSTLSSTSMTPSFMINANDSGADHESVTVKKGANVSIMFMVETSGTYHGGLEFISTDPAIDSGPIATGGSKTVTFTATKSFSFQPYWYASQVKKDYLITVNVTD